MIDNIKLWIRQNFFTKKELYDGGALDSRYFTLSGSTGAWTSVTYVSGWEDFFPLTLQPVQYKKAGDFVFLRGICYRTSGSSATIATLPTGFQPLGKLQMMVLSNAALGYIDIETDGDIVLNAGSPTDWVSLNGIVFSVV